MSLCSMIRCWASLLVCFLLTMMFEAPSSSRYFSNMKFCTVILYALYA